MTPALHALVPAAGSGLRFGAQLPKLLLNLRDRPVLTWTLTRLLAAGVPRITVALPSAYLDDAPTILGADPRISWVAGGDSRQDSVERCLEASPGESDDLVLIHDGARPAISVEDIQQTVHRAAESGAAVLGRPMGDTVKRVEDGEIVQTVDRRALFRAETPQVFRRGLLARALESAREVGYTGTDEASLVERLPGQRISVVTAQAPNPKITEPGDWALVEALLEG